MLCYIICYNMLYIVCYLIWSCFVFARVAHDEQGHHGEAVEEPHGEAEEVNQTTDLAGMTIRIVMMAWITGNIPLVVLP